MQLTHLSLTNFRNFARLDIEIPGGPVLLVGGNAQGKTTLLEAIYYLATLTSFHASQDRELISFLAEPETLVVTRIVAEFKLSTETPPQASKSATQKLEIRLILERDPYGATKFHKEILLNGVNRKTGDVIGTFKAVLFLPQMLHIIEGSPEERRRHLNLTLGQVVPNYANDLGGYQRAVTQRNALLKLLGERGGDINQLDYWDRLVASVGSRIVYARIQALQELEKLTASLHSALTRKMEILRLDYQPSFDPMPSPSRQIALPLNAPVDRSGLTLEQIEHGFLARLKRKRSEEIQRGLTTVGPHRDELRFISNGIDLGTFGSRGQCRTAVLAYKLAEVDWMNQRTGQMPVLLLDEVLAELDLDRRADLLARLFDSEQALLTTTDLDLFSSESLKKARIWRINAGLVLDSEAEGS